MIFSAQATGTERLRDGRPNSWQCALWVWSDSQKPTTYAIAMKGNRELVTDAFKGVGRMTWMLENRSRLEGYRQANPIFLAKIYEHYAPQVVRFLRTRFEFRHQGKPYEFQGLTVPYDLADAMQDVFVQAFSNEAREAYDGLRPFGAYLVGIAKNLMIDKFRRKRLEQRLFIAAEDAKEPRRSSSAMSPEKQAFCQELRDIYNHFVEHLEKRDQTLFVCRFVKEQPRDLVAKQINLTVSQVRVREIKLQKMLVARLSSKSMLRGELLLALCLFLGARS